MNILEQDNASLTAYLYRRRYALGLLLLMAVGAWLRVRHVGDLALIVDEGMQVLGVEGILAYGVPKTGSGLVYARSPFYIYMQAGFASLFGVGPFALRLPSVLFGVAVLVPAYFLGKTLFSRPLGFLTALVLAFSLWEIELSRYGRFYTLFQFFYLVSLICFYRGFMLDEGKYKAWFLLTALLTISSHSLGRIIFVLFLIPLFRPGRTLRQNLALGGWAMGLGGLMIGYNRLIRWYSASGESLINPPVVQNLSIDFLERIRTTFKIPLLVPPEMRFFFQTAQEQPWIIGLLVLVALGVTVYLVRRYAKPGTTVQVLVATLPLWAAVFHQFGIALILLIFYLLVYARDLRIDKDPCLRVVCSVVVVFFVFWLVGMLRDPFLTPRLVAESLACFPNFPRYFLYWYVLGWPILTILLFVGSVLFLSYYIKDRRATVPLFLLGALYLPAFLASLFASYAESRYTFHLYPLIVIIFIIVVMKGGAQILQRWKGGSLRVRQLIILVGLPLAVMVLSQDARPIEAWKIGERTYQTPEDPIRSVICWEPYAIFHQDHESPGHYVRDRLGVEDKVIYMGPIHMTSLYTFYVGKPEYALVPENQPYHYGRIKDGKPINYVSGTELVAGLSGLQEMMETYKGRLWLIGDYPLLREDTLFYSAPLREFVDARAQAPDFLARDGRTFVIKLP